ncbi:hypothetical protein, partial [uncultured Acetatifactor sp.]|uniref:hypothetical protein n=1 Tax=uncultured Acetatifactor sp. TaxID=1671927 RepID=UPI0026269E65
QSALCSLVSRQVKSLGSIYRRQPDKSMAFQPPFRLEEGDSVDRIIWRASYKNVTPGGGNVT